MTIGKNLMGKFTSKNGIRRFYKRLISGNSGDVDVVKIEKDEARKEIVKYLPKRYQKDNNSTVIKREHNSIKLV